MVCTIRNFTLSRSLSSVSRADTCCAILLREKPSLKPLLLPNLGESAIPGFTIGDLKDRLYALTKSSDLSRKIIYIWLRLRYLTELLESIPDKNSSAIDDMFFTDKIDFIERHTLSVLHLNSLAECSAVEFLTAFLNASLVYIYEELRECPKWTNVCICLSQRIRSGLQVVNQASVIRHCPDLLLWILLLGRSGNSPLGEPGRLWYSNLIAHVEENLQIKVPAVVSGLRYFELAEETRPNGSPSQAKSENKGPVKDEAG
jgi:hypothetical protein